MFLIHTFNLSNKTWEDSLEHFVRKVGGKWSREFREELLERPENQVSLSDTNGLWQHICQSFMFDSLQFTEAGFAVGFICGQFLKPKDAKTLKTINKLQKEMEKAGLLPKEKVQKKAAQAQK